MELSIIIPVFNVGDYLNRCLDSILYASIQNTEILLIDDGSTDASGSICDKYALQFTNIKVIHTLNRGVSEARNEGIRNATGEFLTFVDADDYVTKDWYRVICDSIANNSADIIMFGHKMIRKKKTITIIPSKRQYLSASDFIISADFRHTVWSYVIRRSCIIKNEVWFPHGIKYSEDQAFLYKLFSNAPLLKLVDKVLYLYDEREGSAVSKKINMEMAQYYIMALSDVVDYLVVKPCKISENFCHVAANNLMWDYLHYVKMATDYNIEKTYELFRQSLIYFNKIEGGNYWTWMSNKTIFRLIMNCSDYIYTYQNIKRRIQKKVYDFFK